MGWGWSEVECSGGIILLLKIIPAVKLTFVNRVSYLVLNDCQGDGIAVQLHSSLYDNW